MEPQNETASSEAHQATLRWRKRQVRTVAIGVAFFLIALIGGAMKSPIVAQVGVSVSGLCLIAILVMGVMAALSSRKR